MMMRRIRKRKKPPTSGQQEQRDGVSTDLVERQRALEVVDGILEKPRPRQREHVGDNDTGEAEQERTPVFGEIP